MKAIETTYAGFNFRSRLEARWAVFFDAMGIEWKYENEGYENECGERYLPDFDLGGNLFAEVKGDDRALYKNAAHLNVLHDGQGILPGFNGSATPGERRTYRDFSGLILLGGIPEANAATYFHPIIQHHKGVLRRWVTFVCGFAALVTDPVITYCLNGNEDDYGDHIWLVRPRTAIFEAVHYESGAAYGKARAARFEYGQTPLRPAKTHVKHKGLRNE